MSKSTRVALLVSALTACLILPIHGQGITGTVTGMVRDPAGAVIPGVEVTVVHLGTNATYRGVSNDVGLYTIRALPIGLYNLTAELPGFKRFEVAGIRVQVDENVRVDVHLQIGEPSESVQVTGTVIGVDTQSSAMRTVVDQRRVEELPLDGRNPADLIRLVGGVSAYAGTSLSSGTTYPGYTFVSVSGSRGNATNFVLDGGNHNDHYNNANSPIPNPDALAEFSVQTDNFSAEHGRNMGAVVNVVTKSGTNRISGSAFGFVRNKALNAANFFALPRPDDPGKKQDDGLKRSQFGATIGGPVRLGNLYDGRDKTFFFFSYQGTRIRRTPTVRFVNTFTAAERQGDFSGVSKQLIDPFSGEPYPNNQIPAEHHSAVARYLLDNMIPVPETGRTLDFQIRDDQDDDQFMVKVDHNLSAANTLMVRFNHSSAQQPPILDKGNIYTHTRGYEWRNQGLTVRDTHAFGPSLINETVFSFNDSVGPFIQIYPDKNLNEIGIQGISQDQFTGYHFSMQGLSAIDTATTADFIRKEYSAANTLRWTKGTHQLSMGGDVAYGQGDIISNHYANPRFAFTHAAGFTGHAPADFLIGKFASMAQGIGEFKETRFRRFNLFVHDSMRWTPRLSLDLGLRWEPFFPFYDPVGKLSVWVPGQQSTRFVNAPQGILFPGDPGIPRGGYDTSWKNFAPRIGFAYDLTGDGRAALRAGYGIFYDFPNTIATNSPANQGPFGTRVTIYGSDFNSLSDPWGGFPGGNPLPVIGFDAVGTSVLDPPSDVAFVFPHTAFSYVRDLRNAYMQTWNLTLERQLGEQMIRAAYVGSKGTSLISGRQGNAPLPDPTATTATTHQRRPLYPDFGSVTLIEAAGNSNYHGLQLSAERRFTQGYSVLANYTFSKSMDNNIGSDNKATGTSVTNPLDQSHDRGRSDFDRTHVFNWSSIWELPIRFDNRMVNGVLGGWRTTAIVNHHSGNVFTVFSGVDNARTGTGSQRADLIGDPDALGDNRSRGEIILEYLNKAAFAPNALGTFGDLGRNTFRGPGYTNVDLGLHKRFSVIKEVTTEFRFEMFNAFNQVNLNNPTTSRTSANFMRITGAKSPRILQFALRFVW